MLRIDGQHRIQGRCQNRGQALFVRDQFALALLALEFRCRARANDPEDAQIATEPADRTVVGCGKMTDDRAIGEHHRHGEKAFDAVSHDPGIVREQLMHAALVVNGFSAQNGFARSSPEIVLDTAGKIVTHPVRQHPDSSGY